MSKTIVYDRRGFVGTAAMAFAVAELGAIGSSSYEDTEEFTRKTADPRAGGMRGASGDDVPAGARFVGVGGDRFVGVEVQVALNGKAEFAAHGAKFGKAYVAEFGFAHAKIAEAEGQAVGVDFGQEPGALGVGGEEFNDGLEVERAGVLVDRGALRAAVGEELFGLCFGDEFH